MSSINTISAEKLARLIGTPNCPAIIDVRDDDDFAADPRLIPGSLRRGSAEPWRWAEELNGAGSAIVVCQKGLKLSHGVAAWLRNEGYSGGEPGGRVSLPGPAPACLSFQPTSSRRAMPRAAPSGLRASDRRSTASPVPG